MSGPPVAAAASEREDRRSRGQRGRHRPLELPPAFDWAAEKGRISFAFIKATEGTSIIDPEFAANWQAAKALGIVRGAYHFGHPKNGAANDSRAFLATVRAHGLEPGDLLALDLETTDGLGPQQVAEYARNWCTDVHRATGHTPVVYTFLSFAEEGNCAGLGRNPLWIAEPSAPAAGRSCPTPGQRGSSTSTEPPRWARTPST